MNHRKVGTPKRVSPTSALPVQKQEQELEELKFNSESTLNFELDFDSRRNSELSFELCSSESRN